MTPQPAPPPSPPPKKKWIVRVVYSIFNCFSFTPKTRPWALMIRFDWCLRPASCASTMPHRVWNRVRLANRSWGGLWCQWREAFCVEMMYSAEGAKPPAAHFQPRGGLHPPHDPYYPPAHTNTSAYRCSPPQLHSGEDRGRLTAALQRWQIAQALPETLRQ